MRQLEQRIQRAVETALFILRKQMSGRRPYSVFLVGTRIENGRRGLIITTDAALAGAFELRIAKSFGCFYDFELLAAPKEVLARVAHENRTFATFAQTADEKAQSGWAKTGVRGEGGAYRAVPPTLTPESDTRRRRK